MDVTNQHISPQKMERLNHVYRYTIATLVNDMAEYQEMIASYVAAGFTEDICEYLYVDNIGQNTFDAYEGINIFLQAAKGEYIIITHQDVLTNFDKIEDLNGRIAAMDRLDSKWAVLSNAGGIENDLYQRIAAHVVYADGFDQRVGKLPQRACSVDENFILVKKDANLALSADLKGFHLYGTDLCLVADLLGYTCYVIDFKLTHKSYGNPNKSFEDLLKQLIAKYRHFMRSRTIVTTITDFRLSASDWNTALFKTKLVKKISRKLTKWETKRGTK